MSIQSRIDNDTRVFSIEVRDAEVGDVLSALAAQSGFNIILGSGVEGRMSLSFKEIAFSDALEIIIKAHGLTYTIRNNVFWVDKKVDRFDDIEMKMILLNYADPASAAAQLEGILSPDGLAYPDARTNAVIIRDLPANLERAREHLEVIDLQTPQVEIEARIVEASSNFTRQFGVQWGGSYSSGRDVLTGSNLLPSSAGDRKYAVNLPSTSATSGLGLVLGNITNNLLLDIELSAAESRGDLRIVSRPRISTLSNKAATIHSGLTFRVKLNQAATTGTTTAASTDISGLEEIKTGIDLTVIPTVTHDGFIILDIDTNKSDPDYTHVVDGIPGVSEKSASTNVLIRDGETVVIGGLYKSVESHQNDAVPLLSRIPVLGLLFRSNFANTTNEELLVFITPRIVNHSVRASEVLN
jgi:type IV pilus assembly protein PilQ